MFNVKVTKDYKKFITVLTYDEPVTIKEIINNFNYSDFDLISFKLNNKFVNSNELIKEDSNLDLVSLSSEEGLRIYQDSAIFLLSMAFSKLFPQWKKIIIKNSISDGVYWELKDGNLTTDEISKLKEEMRAIVSKELYIHRISMDNMEAWKIFKQNKRKDIINNISYSNFRRIYIYKCGDYYDYFIRPLCDNTGVVKEFDIVQLSEGFILRFPGRKSHRIKPEFKFPEKVFNIHNEYDRWLKILKIHNLSNLNEKIQNYEISKAIQIEEALHESKIVKIVDDILKYPAKKLILIAGPSSSGKTTFASRLGIQFSVNGIYPKIINMDDYFLPRTHTPKKPNGDFDFESVNALDLDLLNDHLIKLVNGQEIELPRYNFVDGTRYNSGIIGKLEEDNVLIIEGIHALNEIISETVPQEKKVKIYISCLTQLNIDDHNRISTTHSRRIRRMSRDHYHRGYTAEATLLRWPDVREGESKNIFPFQEDADYIFNSALSYELGVLKKHVVPLLKRIQRYSPVYTESQCILHLLSHVLDIPDNFVPSYSILKEFLNSH